MQSSDLRSGTAGERRQAALVFPRTGQPQGFATLATTKWDGNPEPVIREILQNSLDAWVNKKSGSRRCSVAFTIRDVPPDEVPGMHEYRRHFERAASERGTSVQGPAEKAIVSRIERVLAQERMNVLLCRDNGIGLTPETMTRLLTEGNTDKADAGAGAFGVGHLTAFAASDTRYVLYAGRYLDGNTNGDGRWGAGSFEDVASAHAILASRTRPGGDNTIRGLGANGYWMLSSGEGPEDEQLNLFQPHYPAVVPDLLLRELDRLRGTGTVLCITGFNEFRDDEEMAADAIARVAAKNFLVAIQRGNMVVEVLDERNSARRRHIVDHSGLRSLLLRDKNQRRAKAQGWLAGEQAFRCLRTLEEGERLNLACGAVARVRRLDPSEGTTSRVQLFRNGMWIDNRADALTASNFTGFNPFDAVVMVDTGEVGTLVRGAEGPEHRGLERKRLENRAQRLRLLELLREIGDELRENVGELEQTKQYTPDDFAVFRGHGARVADRVAPYRPRKLPKADAIDIEIAAIQAPQPSGDLDARTIDPAGTGKGGKGRGAKPAPGNTVPGRLSVKPIPNGDGGIEELRVYWRPENHRPIRSGKLGVRVRLPSGSDETCELPLGPTWLRIQELRLNDGASLRPDTSGFEVSLPHGELEFTLRLAAPLIEANAIEVDIVGRGPTPAKEP